LAISHLKYGTSVGPDNITYDTLCRFHEAAPHLLPHLFTACLRYAAHPPEWKTANCVVIPKSGKKSYSHPKSYRPISLQSCFGKLLESMHSSEPSPLLPTLSARRRQPIGNQHGQRYSHTMSRGHSIKSTRQHFRKSCTNARCRCTSPDGSQPLTLLGKWHLDLISSPKTHNHTNVVYRRDHQSHRFSFLSTAMPCSKSNATALMQLTPPMWTMSACYGYHLRPQKPIHALKNEPNGTWKAVYTSVSPLQCPKLNSSMVYHLPVKTKT